MDKTDNMKSADPRDPGRRSKGRALVAAIAVPIMFCMAIFSYYFLSQESILFVPTKLPQNHQFEFEVPFEELSIVVEGAELNSLHFKQPNPRGLIFFLHGNGGNLESWTNGAEFYQRINYDMFIFDYRGYGKSGGEIRSEAQLHDDVEAAWNLIAPQYPDLPIVVYGRSLGTALATRLAHNVEPDLLILVSPFSSVVAMAQQQYPFLPEWMIRYPLRTDELIGHIDSPIVFVHGDQDRLIPLTHSLELAKHANSSSKLLVIRGAGHNDIHQFESYLDGLTAELPN